MSSHGKKRKAGGPDVPLIRQKEVLAKKSQEGNADDKGWFETQHKQARR